MATINAYIKFSGVAEEAMKFYKNALGGEFIATLRYGDNAEEADKVNLSDKDKIAFMVLAVGNGTTIMASDVIGSAVNDVIEGNNMYVYINMETRNAVDAAFSKLKIGGNVRSTPGKTPWGGYYCEFVDKFDISWIINYQQDLGPLSRRP
jgi:PhnB protein